MKKHWYDVSENFVIFCGLLAAAGVWTIKLTIGLP